MAKPEDEQELFSSLSAVVDSSILFSFLFIGQLENLACSFQVLLVTPLVYGEVKNRKQRTVVDDLVKRGLIEHVEPDVHESYYAAVIAQKAYGKEVGDADREAVAVARCRGCSLLFEDTPMGKVARDIGIDRELTHNTVECLKRLSDEGSLTVDEARQHLESINERRVRRRLRRLDWEGH